MTTIYGIKNCDTMKKAFAWLTAHDVAYRFHDYKTAGITRPLLEGWITALGWDAVINRAGTTFRKLPESDRRGLTEKKAIAMMLTQPSMIKRPILVHNSATIAGFKPDRYEKLFGVPNRPVTE